MNEVVLNGIIRNIQPSHKIGEITFDKAEMIVKRDNGSEDIINLRFKSFCNKYKEDDEISIRGNLRSYSKKISENKNKVTIYVFTYFDNPEVEDVKNSVTIDGRICKINELRTNKSGKHNLHFIIANNLVSSDTSKRLNSYIPCIVWGQLAKEMSKLSVNTKLELTGEIHSREHRKIHEDGTIEFRVAHELLVLGYKVIE